MKIGIIFTVLTPQLLEDTIGSVKAAVGEDAEIITFDDASVLEEIKAAGRITAPPAARYVEMCMKAAEQNVDAILCACSSVGDVADAMQDIARLIGIPIVRIDEEMCREAVRLGKRVAILATQPTTLAPTRSTVQRAAREMGREVETIDCYMEGAFGLDPEQFLKRLSDETGKVAGKADVILLAQGSMAYAQETLRNKYNMPVLASPRFGAESLRRALVAKGVMK